MTTDLLPWILFHLIVFALLALDLGVLNRKEHVIEMREAIGWSIFWTVIALMFNLWVYYSRGPDAGINFLAAYIMERALSLDNLFVFLLIFSYFKVEAQYQHRVLFWGIVGALIMRAVFIAAGVTVIQHFHWALYLMGAFLIFTGVKMGFQKEIEIDPEKNPVVRLCSRMVPMSPRFDESRFFSRIDGKLLATPMFLVLIFVETSDVMFAIDSIPAVLAITQDPFIVYTSNVMAILGMRALYFAIAALYDLFAYLKIGLSLILVLVGVKMLIADFIHVPVWFTLISVVGILAFSILASIVFPPDKMKEDSDVSIAG